VINGGHRFLWKCENHRKPETTETIGTGGDRYRLPELAIT